jgi:hypothetical protein
MASATLGLIRWRECDEQGVVAHAFIDRGSVVFFVLLDGIDLRRSCLASADVLRANKTAWPMCLRYSHQSWRV